MFDFVIIWTVAWILRVTYWILLIVSGIWLYRVLKLRALPWLGVHFALSIILGFITDGIVRQLITEGTPPFGWTSTDFAMRLSSYHFLTHCIVNILVILLALSEIIFLMSKSDPTQVPTPMRPFLLIQRRMTVVGTVLILLTLAYPSLIMAFWIA